MNTITIDTSNNQKVIVGLRKDNNLFREERGVEKNRDQAVLPLIESLLTKHSLKLSDINSVEVHTGPGSFTGIRVGISIANAFSFALKIPVNGKKIGEFVDGTYE